MKTLFQQYNEFADAVGNDHGTICIAPDPAFLEMCLRLVDEEYVRELLPAVSKYMRQPSIENFTEISDGIVDTVYVLMQLARTIGVPFDACWDEVHSSNMAKVVDGKVLRREDGKILKPEGWKPPALWDICLAAYTQRMVNDGKKALGD